MLQTNLRIIVCLSWSLSVICCRLFVASFLLTSICRGLEKLPKIWYFILVDSNVVLSRHNCWAGRQHYPMPEKNISKMSGICV